MFHDPGVVIAQAIGQFDLVEGFIDRPLLAPVIPGARNLMLIENAEFHRVVLPLRRM